MRISIIRVIYTDLGVARLTFLQETSIIVSNPTGVKNFFIDVKFLKNFIG